MTHHGHGNERGDTRPAQAHGIAQRVDGNGAEEERGHEVGAVPGQRAEALRAHDRKAAVDAGVRHLVVAAAGMQPTSEYGNPCSRSESALLPCVKLFATKAIPTGPKPLFLSLALYSRAAASDEIQWGMPSRRSGT